MKQKLKRIYLVEWPKHDWKVTKPFSTLEKAIGYFNEIKNKDAMISEYRVDEIDQNSHGKDVTPYEKE